MKQQQKFKRGDVVHIAKDLGPMMSHFTADVDAIVMGSYRDQFGVGSTSRYTLMFLDGYECSWYDEYDLTLLRHGGEEEITKVKQAREAKEEQESDLVWIVENWKKLKKEGIGGATLNELIRLMGVAEPWGPRGEGVDYYINAQAAVRILDPVLCTGDLDKVRAFLAGERNLGHATPDEHPSMTEAEAEQQRREDEHWAHLSDRQIDKLVKTDGLKDMGGYISELMGLNMRRSVARSRLGLL